MAEEIRRISCLDSRIRDNPCMEPATWEVAGPIMTYLCDEHLEDRIAEDMTERWEQWGAAEYLSMLHEAIKIHYKLSGHNNGVLKEAGEEVMYHLEQELERARQAYQDETGEEPPPTYAELDREAFVKELLGEED